jgi:hypothetical protein
MSLESEYLSVPILKSFGGARRGDRRRFTAVSGLNMELDYEVYNEAA